MPGKLIRKIRGRTLARMEIHFLIALTVVNFVLPVAADRKIERIMQMTRAGHSRSKSESA